MKTIFTLFTFMVLTLFGFTQPVISNVEPAIGDQFLYTQADNTDYTPGPAGADVYWDFSDLYAQALNDLNYTILAPSEGEESESFPEATSVWYSNFELGTDRHIYLSFENDMLTTYGSIIVSSSLMSSFGDKYYSNTEEGLTFPITYQDSGSDTYDGHYISELFGLDRDFSGSLTYVADGHGTVETQYGVFENVLRVTTIKHEVIEHPNSDYYTAQYFTQNSWYSNGYPVPVLMTTTSYEVDYEGTIYEETSDTSFEVSALATFNGLATKVENKSAEKAFTIYPNPALEYIVLDTEVQGNAQLKVFSSDGKLVLEKPFQSHEKINVSHLAPGYYIGVLTTESRRFLPVSFVVGGKP